MNKALCLVAMIFCFLPLLGGCFLTCWVFDDDRNGNSTNHNNMGNKHDSIAMGNINRSINSRQNMVVDAKKINEIKQLANKLGIKLGEK